MTPPNVKLVLTAMNRRWLNIVAAASIALAMGCDRGTKEPAEMSVQQLKETIDARFRSSSSKVKGAEASLSSALQKGDMALAFSEARALSENSELSPEERAAAAQAVVATFKELKKAADSGDKQAEDVVHAYISTR